MLDVHHKPPRRIVIRNVRRGMWSIWGGATDVQLNGIAKSFRPQSQSTDACTWTWWPCVHYKHCVRTSYPGNVSPGVNLYVGLDGDSIAVADLIRVWMLLGYRSLWMAGCVHNPVCSCFCCMLVVAVSKRQPSESVLVLALSVDVDHWVSKLVLESPSLTVFRWWPIRASDSIPQYSV